MSDYPRAVKSNTKAPDYRIGCSITKVISCTEEIEDKPLRFSLMGFSKKLSVTK